MRERGVESKAVCKQINEADRSGGGKTSYKIKQCVNKLMKQIEVEVERPPTKLLLWDGMQQLIEFWPIMLISWSQVPNPSWLLQQIFISTQTCTRVGWGQGIFLEVIVILSYLNIFSVIFIIFKFNFY